MIPHADVALYDHDGRLTAVAEIKNTRKTSREWAVKLRRNLLAHAGYGRVEFFLLATPDRLYLWKGAGVEPAPVQPRYDIDAAPIFRPYFEQAGVDPAAISAPAFELVVGAWLADLVRSGAPSEQLVAEQRWLIESGFLDAVRNGRVEYDIAA